MATIEASTLGGNWSETGAWVGGVVPGEGDDAVLGASSGNITIAAEAKCRSLQASAYVKTLTFSSTLKIGTSTSNAGLALKFGSGMTVSGTEKIEFVSSSTEVQTITTAGKAMPRVTFTKSGKYRLEDKYNGTSQLIEVRETAELNTNGQEVTTKSFNSFGSEIIKLGASKIICSGTSGEVWGLAAGTTLEAGTSTIEITGTGSSAKTFNGTSKTYNVVTIAAENVTLKGTNTFGTLNLNIGGFANSLKFEKATKQTISTAITCNSGVGSVAKMESTEAGSAWEISKASGVLSFDYLELRDSHAVGGATWNAGAHSINVSGNQGWIFVALTVPLSPMPPTFRTPRGLHRPPLVGELDVLPNSATRVAENPLFPSGTLYPAGFIYPGGTPDISVTVDTAVAVATRGRLSEDKSVTTEVLSRTVSFVRTATDSSVDTESLAGIKSLNKTITDSSASTDSVARIISLQKSASDLLKATDSASRSAALIRLLTDLSVETDQTSSHVNFVRIAENFTYPGTLYPSLILYPGGFPDAGVTVDSVASTVIQGRNTTDKANTTEQITRGTSLTRSLTDESKDTDSVKTLRSLIRFAENFTYPEPGLLPTEGLYPGGYNDSAKLADSNTIKVVWFRSISDSAKTTENLSRVLSLHKSLTDLSVDVDSVLRTTHIQKTITDSSVLNDVALRGVAGFPRTSLDLSKETDAATRLSLFFPRTSFDAAIVLDSLSRGQNLPRNLIDTAFSVDRSSRTVGFTRLLSDLALAKDTNQIREALHRASTDHMIALDVGRPISSFLRSGSDAALIFDPNLHRGLHLVRLLSDQSTDTDTAPRRLHRVVSIADNLLTVDSIHRLANLIGQGHDGAVGIDIGKSIVSTRRSSSDLAIILDTNTHVFSQPRSAFDHSTALDSLVFLVLRVMGSIIWVEGTDVLLVPFSEPQLVTNGNEPIPSTLITGSERQIVEDNLNEQLWAFGETEALKLPSGLPELLLEPGGATVVNKLQVYEGKIIPRGDEPDVFSYQLTSFPDSVNKPREMTAELV